MNTVDFSVITIHKNDFLSLEQTRASLQSYFGNENFEWVVIDGDSQLSGERDIGRVMAAKEAAAIFISEPDSGIYDAMNRGLQHCSGVYVVRAYGTALAIS